ncbi:Fimbrial protein [Shewanella sp. MR-4]|uniref:fimbrial protein n=1 Tax=Shewanella sp. (strain MR-4) TaxID=60480 RepID=UPI00005E567F|nr:fimbrial protein [Shewanella sp. MR-4]ABI39306.1 Fimbrial protein [Shewanella sp. MR-4]
MFFAIKFRFCVFCLLLFFSEKILAYCTSVGAPNVYLNASINMGDVSQGDMSDSSVFTSDWYTTGGNGLYWTFYGCSSAGSSHWFYSPNSQIETIDSTAMFATNNPNVFYELWVKDSGGPWINLATISSRHVNLRNHPDGNGWYSAHYKTRFHVRGVIDKGIHQVYGGLGYAYLSENQYSNNGYVSRDVSYLFTVNVNPGTCSFSTEDDNKVVNLPTVNVGDFNGVGTGAGEKNFNLNVTCQSGTKAYISFSDAYNSSNSSDSLSTLTSTTSADGVNIQILSNNWGGAIVLNTPFYVVGADDSAAASYTIPFSARYIQVDPVLTAGTVEAKTIVVMTYE